MKTLASLDGIWDGKFYGIKDMVKADAGGCDGCSVCCHGVGELVQLTPYDLYEITYALNCGYSDLIDHKIELRQEKGLELPHLKMLGETEACSFLDDQGRCTLHQNRPNICRLFPLGRIYEDRDFKYFLQVDACTKTKLGKVKIKKWLGIERYNENKAFILKWQDFIQAVNFRMKFIQGEEEKADIRSYVLNHFFRFDLEDKEDFYDLFDKQLALAKEKLGII